MGSFRTCTSSSAYNMCIFLPTARHSCACRAASKNLHPTFFFPSLQRGMAVARGAFTVLKQVFRHPSVLSSHRNQDTLWQCRLLLPPVASAAATGLVLALVMMEKFMGKLWRQCPRTLSTDPFPEWGQRSYKQPLLAHLGNVTCCREMQGNGNIWKYDAIRKNYSCKI